MKRFTINTKTALALGWGLALVLLWMLSTSTGLPVATAADLQVCSTCTYTTIQSAVDAAGDGDVIKVAQGTYNNMYTVFGVKQVVYISKSVSIQGGYTAPGFADPPDPAANPTIVDAQGQGRVLYIAGNISPTIEGLRMTGGDAAQGGGSNDGGGVYVVTATVTINTNQVFSNTAQDDGGGLYLEDSNYATLSANTVYSNTSGSDGGGLYLVYSHHATLSANTFYSNTSSSDGGGVNLEDSHHATLSANTFYSNTAGSDGGGVTLDESSSATLLANTFYSNTSGADGGGLYLEDSNYATLSANTFTDNHANNEGGGLELDESLNGTVSANTFYSNTAGGDGGGVSLDDDSYAILSANNIYYNTADDDGGGMYLDGGSAATFSANTVYSNTAIQGGGIFLGNDGSAVWLTNNVVADNWANTEGSGLYIDDSSSHLLHNTIARNSGGDGSGVHVTGNSSVDLINNIVVSHTVGITVEAGIVATLDSTLWYGNATDWDGAGTINRSNDYSGDPAFVNPEAVDYHIRATSAAIDKGVDAGVTTDIDNEIRPRGLAPDLGVDEWLSFIGLAIAKSAPATAWVGDPLTYTIVVSNSSAADVTNMVITDTVPANTTCCASIGQGGILLSNQEILWFDQVVSRTSTLTLTFVVTVNQVTTGTIITNDAYRVVSSDQGLSTGLGNPVNTRVGGPWGSYLPLIFHNP